MLNADLLNQSVEALRRSKPDLAPSCAMVLGSGWSEVVADIRPLTEVSYADIPCLGATGVAGHPGRLIIARPAGSDILLFMGRRHRHEGLGWEPVIFPAYAAARLGCSSLVLTCAAGGIRDTFVPGDLMAFTDHINLMGNHPLAGSTQRLGLPAFPDMSQVYAPHLLERLVRTAAEERLRLHQGVYAALTGPTYETPAEIRALGALGADAVGMSTVPEAVVGHAMGLSVAALACIANPAAGLTPHPLSHNDVIAQVNKSRHSMRRLLKTFLNPPDSTP